MLTFITSPHVTLYLSVQASLTSAFSWELTYHQLYLTHQYGRVDFSLSKNIKLQAKRVWSSANSLQQMWKSQRDPQPQHSSLKIFLTFFEWVQEEQRREKNTLSYMGITFVFGKVKKTEKNKGWIRGSLAWAILKLFSEFMQLSSWLKKIIVFKELYCQILNTINYSHNEVEEIEIEIFLIVP